MTISSLLERSPLQTLEGRVTARSFGTFLVLLTAPVIYADKIVEYFDIQVQYDFKYYIGLDVFLWTISQTVVVLLLLFSFFFRPYKWSLLIPITVFSIQLSYIFRDEKWIQGDYYFVYTVIFVITILASIYFVKYAIASVISSLNKSKKKDIETLVNFVIEVRNEHYANILKGNDALELLDEFECNEIEKQWLREILRKERRANTRKFEIRIVQTLHEVDSD